MWLREESPKDNPPTGFEYDKEEIDTFTDSEAASMNDPHSESGDDWNEKTSISDESKDEPL